MKKHIFSLWVKNKHGVLSRVAGAFNRVGYNIDSFTSGKIEEDGTYRMTIVSSGDKVSIDLIRRQLNRLIDVINVVELDPEHADVEELVLIKLKISDKDELKIIGLAETFDIQVIRNHNENLILKLVAPPDVLDIFLKQMNEFDILSVNRSGAVAI